LTEQALRAGAAELGVALNDEAIAKLVHYLELLARWNRVFNLTAIDDTADRVTLHLLDSLAVIPHLPAGSMVDVGSGAGLPGIPVAIACRERSVTLLDSSRKKGAFLQQAISELGLHGTRVETARAENYRPQEGFAVVISRAFAKLGIFVSVAKHLCAAGGRLVAMKGAHPTDELTNLPAAAIEKVVSLAIPGLNAQRHLVFIDPSRLEPG
jgi:16S rRNA (guanine527-N7)-methyltransferase